MRRLAVALDGDRLGRRLRDDDGRGRGHRRGLGDVLKAVAQPAAREPDRERVERAPSKRVAVLYELADRAQCPAESSLHGHLGQADVARDLAVGVAAEVSKLDDMLVLSRQRAHSLVNCMPDHRARKVFPPMRLVVGWGHAFDQDLLEPFVCPAHPAGIDGSSAGTCHQPRPPDVVRGRGKRVILGFRHLFSTPLY
ncbi:MAG: hypothetical protein AUI15_14225 [Actinobacteria bacterium 13_2_20CM_2_66_6]|nr:MAG: hypothetical protein AUI15_14225 [Actinobacteria bacterium 13_2_20CM_2_66_6]